MCSLHFLERIEALKSLDQCTIWCKLFFLTYSTAFSMSPLVSNRHFKLSISQTELFLPWLKPTLFQQPLPSQQTATPKPVAPLSHTRHPMSANPRGFSLLSSLLPPFSMSSSPPPALSLLTWAYLPCHFTHFASAVASSTVLGKNGYSMYLLVYFSND